MVDLVIQRHLQLALQISDTLERSQAKALNPAVVNEYFDLLYSVLDDNGILNIPTQMKGVKIFTGSPSI